MDFDISDFLIKFGFNKSELDNIKRKNLNIYFASYNQIVEIINTLKEKNFSDIDIKNIIIDNPLLLTENPTKIYLIDEKLKQYFNISDNEINMLIKNNSIIYMLEENEIDKLCKKYSDFLDFSKFSKCILNSVNDKNN